MLIDEADEEELDKKPELEKEQILKDRFERRQLLLEKYEFVKQQKLMQ